MRDPEHIDPAKPFEPEQIDDLEILLRMAGRGHGPGRHHGPHGPHGPGCGPFGPGPDDHRGPGPHRPDDHHGPGRRGGRTQMAILHILAEEGPLSQRVLQGMLRVQPGSLSEILTKLEDRGYIVRKREEDDRRRVLVELTEEGRTGLEEMRRQHRRRPLPGIEALTPEEQETLKTLLRKMLAASRPDEHAPNEHAPEEIAPGETVGETR